MIPPDHGKPGLAAAYPRDRGIGKDPRVLFAEGFEADALETVRGRWDTASAGRVLSLSDDVPPGSAGCRSLLMAQRAEHGAAVDLYRRLPPGHERVFMRQYVKIAPDCVPIHHFGSCLGGNRPATPWPTVKAGEPPPGDRGFWVGIEPFGAAWRWDYYAYWCDMRGSPPRGQTWGNSFLRDQAPAVARGRWTCIETMVKMNAVGAADGELALWIDGKLLSHLGPGFPKGLWTFDKFQPGAEGEGVRWNRAAGRRENFRTAAGGDPFEGFRFRTTKELAVNFVWLYLYITKTPPGQVNRVWFDDLVVATEYIGPLAAGG